jgi:hypothetical protein
MTRGNQVFDDGRADETSGAGDKHTHEEILQAGTRTTVGSRPILVK